MDVVEDARQYFTRGHATPFAGHDVELTVCLELTDAVTLDEVNGYCKRFSVATWGNGYGHAEVTDDPHRFRQVTLQHPISEGLDGSIEGGWSEERLRLLLDQTLAKVRSFKLIRLQILLNVEATSLLLLN